MQGWATWLSYEPALAEGPPWPNINAKDAAAASETTNCIRAELRIAFVFSVLHDVCVFISTSFVACETPDEPESLI
jgi:hypothetical protein